MEDFNISDLQFEDLKLDNLVYDLSHIFRRQNGVFVDLCVTIYKIWEYCKGNYWKAKDNEYYNVKHKNVYKSDIKEYQVENFVLDETNYKDFSEYKFSFKKDENNNYYFVNVEQTK